MFEQYARQLSSDGLYHKSATILLCMFQVYEAIRVLASNGLYKFVYLTWLLFLLWIDLNSLTVQLYVKSTAICRPIPTNYLGNAYFCSNYYYYFLCCLVAIKS